MEHYKENNLGEKEYKHRIHFLENENKYLKNAIEKLKNENNLLQININGDISKIRELKKFGVTGEKLQPTENLIRIDSDSGRIIVDNNPNREIEFKDFYDVIVDIKSIKDITKGWEIKINKKVEKEYKDFKEGIIKIGVIGNSNKGKSFILSKIAKMKLPSGTSIRTEGLSIKYPDLEINANKRIVLLDSCGLETPVLKENYYKNKKVINEQDKQEKINIIDNEENEESEINEKKINENELENNEKIINNQNENDEEENNKKQESSKNEEDKANDNRLFLEKSRDKIFTEFFLQNYIIYNSDILIVVVGILTYSEQKLLNRIKNEIIKKGKNNKNKDTLFIIHNLITYTSIKQVKDYIEDFLLNSATFNLKKGHNISTKLEEEKGVYYAEIEQNLNIYHLFFCNEDSEAGSYYNNFTLEFLENHYEKVYSQKTYDVIESIKERFIAVSKDFIEIPEKIISKENFDNSNNKLIRLKEPKNIKLKRCLIDELGFSNLKANDFEPSYNYYQKGDSIIVRIEGPGNCSIQSSIEYSREFTIIKLKGEKRKDKEPERIEENLFNSREFGKFSIHLPLKIEDFLIKNEDPIITEKKGIIILQYQLDKTNNKKVYIQEDEV